MIKINAAYIFKTTPPTGLFIQREKDPEGGRDLLEIKIVEWGQEPVSPPCYTAVVKIPEDIDTAQAVARTVAKALWSAIFTRPHEYPLLGEDYFLGEIAGAIDEFDGGDLQENDYVSE